MAQMMKDAGRRKEALEHALLWHKNSGGISCAIGKKTRYDYLAGVFYFYSIRCHREMCAVVLKYIVTEGTYIVLYTGKTIILILCLCFISNIQKPLFFKNSPKISALKWLILMSFPYHGRSSLIVIFITQNLGPQKLVKKLSSRQIFDKFLGPKILCDEDHN